jgi:predicted  nucleic acid-binding Zn-ribbon protein
MKVKNLFEDKEKTSELKNLRLQYSDTQRNFFNAKTKEEMLKFKNEMSELKKKIKPLEDIVRAKISDED